ncbi:MAG TPA: hypothetical protein VER58_13295 [Thermoanaerobaculia bacterium]|nr:hypothetical protein [Thermoanaerobaculia bacterium]
MNTCKAKRGFFSLRDCGEPIVKQCALCGRPMCSRHLSPASGFTRCLDCDARQAEKQVLGAPQQPAATPSAVNVNDPAWPYRYRSSYWRSRSYSPIYFGSYYDPYYNDYDFRSFDSDMARRGPSTAPEKADTAGFGDS